MKGYRFLESLFFYCAIIMGFGWLKLIPVLIVLPVLLFRIKRLKGEP